MVTHGPRQLDGADGTPYDQSLIYKTLLAMALAGILSMPAWAQPQHSRFELGARGGVTRVIGTDAVVVGAVVGVEVCAWCSGEYALLAEYSHLTLDRPIAGIESGDTLGAGLRIQGLGVLCFQLCFFDAVVVMSNGRSVNTSVTQAGVILGTGVFIPAGRHLYVRPQVRLYITQAGGASAEVGIGWRF